jgi:crotonobetainyl-CoA:carnitine CoA-transferase CaiB-like acyl-CoA transferase
VKIDVQARAADCTPPMAGEHSREILCEAGYAQRQIDEWENACAVATGGPVHLARPSSTRT